MTNSSETRFDDIMNRLDEGWNTWQDALAQVDERDDGEAARAQSLMIETAQGDEQAVEAIRSFVEDSTYQQLPTSDSVESVETIEDARSMMDLHHERLLGGLRTVAETSEDIVSAVEERIGPLTWERYTARAERLTSTGDAST